MTTNNEGALKPAYSIPVSEFHHPSPKKLYTKKFLLYVYALMEALTSSYGCSYTLFPLFSQFDDDNKKEEQQEEFFMHEMTSANGNLRAWILCTS